MSSRAHARADRSRAADAACVLLIGASGPAGESGSPAGVLAAEGFQVLAGAASDRAWASAHGRTPAFAVVVVRPGDASGLPVLEALRRRWPRLLVLLVTERPAVPEAVAAMQAGAAWYGAPGGDFARAVRAAGERAGGAAEPGLFASGGRNAIVGRSPAMRKALRAGALVAPARTTVLLLGETGTGKERMAQAIHEASPRRRGPFVAVNCAALAETLLESELFGHERGAFSGAHSRREGRFELADGGTIFLDEIGEIAPAVQVKLLRVLQERSFERAGGNETISVDVRVVAATNRDLRAMVAARTFRADLFYRLNVMAIEVPPLRARREDIALLVEHLVPRLALELGLPASPISDEGMAALAAYDWPGNVRELENVLERALLMAQGGLVTSFELPRAASALAGLPLVPGASLREIERHVIMTTYEACGRSPARTADVLGLSPRTVHYRLREYSGQRGRRVPRKAGQTAGTGTEPWHLPAVATDRCGGVEPDN